MTTSKAPEADASGRIVVVDDSWTILEQIRACLAARGYDVRTTTSPDVAVRLVAGADLTIIDFHMPGVNGSELVEMLRAAQGEGGACLFYLYTSDRDEAVRYTRHGFDGAFLKKGDEAALVPQVEAVFRTVRMRRLTERIRKGRTDTLG